MKTIIPQFNELLSANNNAKIIVFYNSKLV